MTLLIYAQAVEVSDRKAAKTAGGAFLGGQTDPTARDKRAMTAGPSSHHHTGQPA